jgi:hypothetical protein
MGLPSAQQSRIAAAYERAAEDETLPPQQRADFATKAEWSRMLAQIAAAKEAAAAKSTNKGSGSDAQDEPLFCAGFLFEALNRGRQAQTDQTTAQQMKDVIL